jgi:hypothetical protein
MGQKGLVALAPRAGRIFDDRGNRMTPSPLPQDWDEVTSRARARYSALPLTWGAVLAPRGSRPLLARLAAINSSIAARPGDGDEISVEGCAPEVRRPMGARERNSNFTLSWRMELSRRLLLVQLFAPPMQFRHKNVQPIRKRLRQLVLRPYRFA